jgi:thioesterase domain-containing protein
LEQRTQFVHEAKSVLDSWVRYEAQVKQRQQKELAETLILKVKKELETPRVLQQILMQAVADVESTSSEHFLSFNDSLTIYSRDRYYHQAVNTGQKSGVRGIDGAAGVFLYCSFEQFNAVH